MIRPPLLSLVFVGISGFCGSPALTITTSVRTLPVPQPTTGATASNAQAPKAAAARIRRKPSSSDQNYNPGVTVTELAGGDVAEQAGYLTAMFGTDHGAASCLHLPTRRFRPAIHRRVRTGLVTRRRVPGSTLVTPTSRDLLRRHRHHSITRLAIRRFHVDRRAQR